MGMLTRMLTCGMRVLIRLLMSMLIWVCRGARVWMLARVWLRGIMWAIVVDRSTTHFMW